MWWFVPWNTTQEVVRTIRANGDEEGCETDTGHEERHQNTMSRPNVVSCRLSNISLSILEDIQMNATLIFCSSAQHIFGDSTSATLHWWLSQTDETRRWQSSPAGYCTLLDRARKDFLPIVWWSIVAPLLIQRRTDAVLVIIFQQWRATLWGSSITDGTTYYINFVSVEILTPHYAVEKMTVHETPSPISLSTRTRNDFTPCRIISFNQCFRKSVILFPFQYYDPSVDRAINVWFCNNFNSCDRTRTEQNTWWYKCSSHCRWVDTTSPNTKVWLK